MISHWEEFNAGPTERLDRRMHVTLSPKNVILLNGNMHEQLGKPDAVVLLFDKVNSVIGVRPDIPGRGNAFPVTRKGPGRHRLIRATPFCRHYGIKVDRVTSFISPDIDADGVLRLDLKATTEIGRRKK